MHNTLLDDALRVLRAGGTLLYPTDTLWGIGCDATLPNAVDKIYAIKQRNHTKAMLVLATSEMLSPALPTTVSDLLLNSSRPTTVVMPAEWLAVPVAHTLCADDGSLGVRVPRMDFCQQLLAALGHPVVSTSANLSGEPSPTSYYDISPSLREHIDFCLPNHSSFPHGPAVGSRILKVTLQGEVIILRE